MTPLCTDTDLLFWEPSLFRDAAAAAQPLVSGVASVTGTAANAPAISLTDAHVAPGHVATFSGAALAGCFPIVAVQSATDFTISVLYDGLYPATGAPVAVQTTSAANQAFAVRTFFPQRRIVTQMILQAGGLDPDSADGVVLNPAALKRPCVLGTLQLIYSALAASAADPGLLTARAELYERLYRRALRAARVEVDSDGDGVADLVRPLNALLLVRG